MKDITIIRATDDSPFVEFNPNNHELKIQGKSLMEDTYAFYFPIMELVEEHCLKEQNHISINVMLDYLNSSTSRYLMEMFMILEKSSADNVVTWYFEEHDDIIEEKGKQFKAITELDFRVTMLKVMTA